jgi:hypothetical protein
MIQRGSAAGRRSGDRRWFPPAAASKKDTSGLLKALRIINDRRGLSPPGQAGQARRLVKLAYLVGTK